MMILLAALLTFTFLLNVPVSALPLMTKKHNEHSAYKIFSNYCQATSTNPRKKKVQKLKEIEYSICTCAKHISHCVMDITVLIFP